jgi:hypothetical protein
MKLDQNKGILSLKLDDGVCNSGFFKIVDGVFKANDSRWFVIKGKVVNHTEFPIAKVYLDIRLDSAHNLKWFVCDGVQGHGEKCITMDIDSLTEFGYKMNHMLNLENITMTLSYLLQHNRQQTMYKLIKVSDFQYEWVKK